MFLSLHVAFLRLLILHTNKCTFYNIMKSKIHIKTFKTFLHVSIHTSPSGSIHCSLLKLYIKTISELLPYINSVMCKINYLNVFIIIYIINLIEFYCLRYYYCKLGLRH
jgi:hypothetical protein